MSEISAEEALLKAKEIAARLTGAGGGGSTTIIEAPSNPAISTQASDVATSTARTERKRKRWGSAPATASANNTAEALPGLTEAKLKQQAVTAKPTGPSSKRVWVPTTRERRETHFSSFLKERLPELSARINCSDFKGDDQNVMELGGRGASTVIIYGMPLEPMHVTIKGSEAFIAAAAPRLEELLAEGERADREGPPPDENDDQKAIEGGDDADKYSSTALTLTRPYYQGNSAKRNQSEYRPATVAQLISGNPDVLGDAGNGSGVDGNAELLEESIRIPNGVVGFIIGRGGETISSMQARSGCKVQIQKEHELQPGQTERVITLQAVKQESIDECREIIESMVRDRVRSAGGTGAHRPSNGGGGAGGDYYGRSGPGGGGGGGGRTDNTEAKVQEALGEGHKLVKVEVPDADVGLIIGKGGTTIKFIQETTGSSVQIPHSADTDNPSVRSISITCPTEGGAEAAKSQILNIIKNKPVNNHNGNNNSYNNGGMNNVAASVQVVIPNKDVGLCIGRQGCVIKQLQGKTNTRIDIPQHPPPGQDVRVINVTGPSQEACELAKTYIERIVNEQSATSVMMGSTYNNNNNFQSHSNNSHHRHGGGGVGYQNQYGNHQNFNGSNNSNSNGGDQNSAQSNDPAWQAYYAAQAIANNKQQQQQQQQQAASAAPASDAYYEQFHRYAYYYGEEAARQYYGTWSPPVGTPNPYGINPNGVTAPPAAESGANAPPASTTATTAQQAPVSTNTAQVRDSSVRRVSNLPAWMTKS
jgi:far upstream element-binding protein